MDPNWSIPHSQVPVTFRYRQNKYLKPNKIFIFVVINVKLLNKKKKEIKKNSNIF